MMVPERGILCLMIEVRYGKEDSLYLYVHTTQWRKDTTEIFKIPE
jgi:hypothetical protein